jgi:hypothetical protein
VSKPLSSAAKFQALYSMIENYSPTPDVLQRCREVLDAGMDVNCIPPEPDGDQHFKLLHLAAHQGWSKFCALLIEYGADPNDFYGGSAPLHMAVEYGWIGACRALVRGGANPSFVPSPSWKEYLTPFQFAVAVKQDTGVDHAETIRLFVEELGADLTQKTLDGRTIEELAGGRPDIQQLLRSLGTERAVAIGIGNERVAGIDCAAPIRTGLAPL